MSLDNIKKAFEYNEKIKGHLAYLDNTRLAFIGEREDDKGTFYIGFRNAEGEDTRIKISHEAMAALVRAYGTARKGKDIFPLKITTEWQVTVVEKPATEQEAGE